MEHKRELKPYITPGSYTDKFTQVLVSSGIANVITKTILAPVERWRIISQTQAVYPLRPKKFNNFFSYLSRIPKEQGLFSFWRGNMASCWIYFYQVLFQVNFYDNLKKYLSDFTTNADDSIEKSILQLFVLPFSASFLSLLFLYPLQTYRVRLNMSYHKSKEDAHFKNFRQFQSYVRINENIIGIYRGFILANIISFLNFHVFYQIAHMEKIKALDDVISQQFLIPLGMLVFIHPLDTIKKILQLNNMSKPALFTGYRGIFNYVNEHFSWRIYYNGLLASSAKITLFALLFPFIQETVHKSNIIKSQ